LAALALASVLVSGLAGTQTPSAQPSASSRRQQPPVLGVDGPQFTVDGTPRFLVVVSYFDALRASDATLEADFGWLRRHGIDGVRIFPNWWKCAAVRQCGGHAGDDTLMAPPDGALRPLVLARLRAVLATAGRHRLIVDLSFARETVRDTQERELPASAYANGLVAAVRALGPAPHVMIDLQNEVYQNRVFAERAADDAPRVAALARRVDGGPRIVFVSTNAAEAERYTYCGADGCPLDVLAIHDAREPDWHDRTPAVVRDLVALGARRGPRPVYLQEPQAWQDERAPDRVERFLDAASRARRAGAAAWTFHTRSAFMLRDGRSLTAQLDADERAVLERVRQRIDAPAAAR
jgi:hypothetical protein